MSALLYISVHRDVPFSALKAKHKKTKTHLKTYITTCTVHMHIHVYPHYTCTCTHAYLYILVYTHTIHVHNYYVHVYTCTFYINPPLIFLQSLSIIANINTTMFLLYLHTTSMRYDSLTLLVRAHATIVTFNTLIEQPIYHTTTVLTEGRMKEGSGFEIMWAWFLLIKL